MAEEVDARRFAPPGWLRDLVDHRPVRLLSLASGVVLVGSYLVVLYHVTDVVGGVALFAAAVVAALLLGTVLSRLLPAPAGIALGAVIFVAGFATYLALIPDEYYQLFTVDRVYADVVALVTGQSVIMLLSADLWAIAIAPGPTFLAWYLTLRRRYALAAAVGGATLGFFVLTGDAGRTTAMLGTAGALGLIGFGSIEKHEGTREQALDVGIVLALALFVARTIDLVPGGRASPTGPGTAPPLESSLLGTAGQVPIGGSISLSPEVRFSVTADRPAYWRVAAYDRYTGQGWVRTGRSRPYHNRLSGPPGATTWLYQEVEVASELSTLPAAWKPIFVGPEVEDRVRITDMGGLEPTESFAPGDRFTVASLRPEWTAEALAAAGTDYPTGVGGRFLRLPDSTPARIGRLAREITADADTPYAAVQALTDWLEGEKGYSLEVPRARWDAADAFVFEMDRGYCVHFATALAVMLRTLDVPSRFVVGYTPGTPDEAGGYTVRGLHSHAWVEVYFPGTGWVRVDPTPSRPREARERARIREAGGGAGAAVDPEAAERAAMGQTTRTDRDPNATTVADAETATDGSSTNGSTDGRTVFRDGEAGTVASEGTETETEVGGADRTGGEERGGLGRDRLSILFGLAGLVLGVHRLGVLEQVYRSFRVRHQEPTGSPATDVRRAMARLEYVLARRRRERRPDETARGYLEALEAEGGPLDDRAHRVVELYERLHYAGRATPTEAREAIRLVDELFDA